jgi:hypothetical protein
MREPQLCGLPNPEVATEYLVRTERPFGMDIFTFQPLNREEPDQRSSFH